MRVRPPFVVTFALASVASFGCHAAEPSARPADATSDLGDDSFLGGPKDCPSADPGYGALRKPCDAMEIERCRYRDECESRPEGSDENVYACRDDGSGKRAWTLVSKEYAPVCPTALPKDGDRCACAIHFGFDACYFGGCETRYYVALCRIGDEIQRTWGIVPVGCNPPEPDAFSIDGGSMDAADTGGD